MNGPRAVCVTGMHRSGTSLVARALAGLGVDLGRADALMGPGPDNPVGYFEIRAMKELDDEVLARLGGSWDRPPVLVPGWESDVALDPYRQRAVDVLHHSFGELDAAPHRIIGWKDPRQSILLPFWNTVTPITTTVVVARDPAEVVASLLSRNGIHPAQGALLWLRYLLSATSNDPGHLMVRHAAFFDDLEATLAALTDHLHLPEPTTTAISEIRGHLDPGLHHHRAAPRADDPNPVLALALTVWNGGEVEPGTLDRALADAIRLGWLRSPADDGDLTAARAQVVELQETVRRRKRKILALERDLEESRRQPDGVAPGAGDTP